MLKRFFYLYPLNYNTMSIKEKILQKKNLWHVGALALFLIVTIFYFTPAFKGYTINQGDVVNWRGAAQEILDYREHGENIHWTNSMFSGMPGVQIAGSYPALSFINTIHQIITLGLPAPASFLFLYFVGFYILALTLRVKPMVGALGAIAYGLSSYFIIILQAGHNTKALAIGYAPFVLAGFIWAYRSKKMIFPLALSGLFMALELKANHIQIAYYLGIVLVFVGITELIKAIKEKTIKNFAIRTIGLIIMYGFAIGLNYGNIKTTLDYAKYTTRGGSELTINPDGTPKDESVANNDGLDFEYITAWSYGIGESFSLIVPNFKGGATQGIASNPKNKNILKDVDRNFKQQISGMNQYWGEQPFTSGPVYVGVIVVFLAILALYYLDDKIKWALLGVTILTLMLSWGKNYEGLSHFFIDYIPGYNKFRAVTIILFVVELTTPILAVLFLNKLIKKREEIKQNIKPFFIISGIFVLLFISFLIAPTLFNSFLANGELDMIDKAPAEQVQMYNDIFDELANVRQSIFRADVLRSFIYLILGIGAIFIGIKNSEFAKKAMVPVLALLILVDLLSVDFRYLDKKTKGKQANWIKKWEQEYPLVAGTGDKQVFDFESNQPQVQEEVSKSVYEVKKKIKANKIKGAQANRMIEQQQFRALNRKTHFRVFEQGNPFNSSRASYFHKSLGGYHGAKLGIYQELIEFHLSQNNQSVLNMLNMKYTLAPGGQQAIPNPNTLGNAWFVKSIKEVESADDEIMALNVQTSFMVHLYNGISIKVGENIDTVMNLQGGEDLVLTTKDSQNVTIQDIPYQAATQQQIALYNTPNGFQWGYFQGNSPDLMAVISSSQSGFTPKELAVIRKDYAAKLSTQSFSGEGQIELTSYNPDKLTYHSNSKDKQLAVFSEIFIKDGWHATIDNQPAEILRTNYVLRAIEIPAGEHEIEMVYHLDTFDSANTMILTFTFIILGLLIFGFYWDYIKNPTIADDLVD